MHRSTALGLAALGLLACTPKAAGVDECGGCDDPHVDLVALEAGTPIDPVTDEPVETEPKAPAKPAQPEAHASLLEGPRLRILGIAQDGGLPHIGCDCERCDAARLDPQRASGVASVAAVDPNPSQPLAWVVDASPDFSTQLDLLVDARTIPTGRVDRSPLDGVLLTHAHMGHYIGLAHLGFEAASAEAVPVHASARMVEFLSTNAPWDQLVRFDNIAPKAATPGTPIELGHGLKAEPLLVPHRGEYTDTLGWYLSGSTKRALYIPDTDPWAKWTADLDAVLEGVDLFLVDGTFYSGDELPGRDLSKIGHPLMIDTMDRFDDRLGRDFELWFIHLNHSNPALDPSSEARRHVESRGFRVAAAGDEYPL